MASDSEMELPCPLFEGSEKRIEVEFAFGAKAPVDGLRSLSREQLDSSDEPGMCLKTALCLHAFATSRDRTYSVDRGNMHLDSLCTATVNAMYCLMQSSSVSSLHDTLQNGIDVSSYHASFVRAGRLLHRLAQGERRL